jgi:hypothetical protein
MIDSLEADMQRLFVQLGPKSTADEIDDYLLLCPGGSTARPYEFLMVHRRIFGRRRWRDAGAAFWRWLPDQWPGFDAIPHDLYQRAFMRWRPDWSPNCMNDDDRRAFEALPATVPIFRGQDAGAVLGLSWTLKREVAKEFARGHRGIRNPAPIVFRTNVAVSEIALFSADRNEAEVVLFAPPSRADFEKLCFVRF